jgi:dethiobiotin synthetase
MIAVVTGTGTGVGKTRLAAALVHALAARGPVVGWKPVESGVAGELGDDEAALAAASAIHAPSIRLREPLSPHLAARRAGVRLDPAALHARLAALASTWPTLVLEPAGGLCSPLDDELDNAGWLAAAPAELRARLRLVLVAPDRLGVLHDVAAALHAAAAHGLAIAAVALAPPAAADLSTGTNAAELAARAPARGRPIVTLPRAAIAGLARHAAIAALLAALGRGRG